MPPTTEYFFSTKPAYPWSEYPLGLPALGILAALLVGITFWTYFKHPGSSRKRVAIILTLRLLALLIALLTAVRPSVGIQEDPKVPSQLILGIDLSESMTIKDEFNSQTRIDAVRKILERCEPILEELRNEQNVAVTMYAFGKTDFSEATGLYDVKLPADSKRSDYGAYLSRTFEKWQTERFIRGHILIGDGADNGTTYASLTEATRWRALTPLHTFSTGSKTTPPNAKDVAIVAVSAEPTPTPIKTEVTIKIIVNAFGFVGATVPVIVKFDDKEIAIDKRTLTKETGNEIEIKVKAPDKPGEVRLKVEIPVKDLPGDANAANNELETYLTVTKEGLRILYLDRHSHEMAIISDILRGEKRFSAERILREGDGPLPPEDRDRLDFDNQAYDVIIIGNISRRQLETIDPKLPQRIRELVERKGVGLLFGAGDASYGGTGDPNRPLDSGWRGSALEGLLPVTFATPPGVPGDTYNSPTKKFQTVPTSEGLKYLFKVNGETSNELWDRMNAKLPGSQFVSRINGLSRFEAKPQATVYAVATHEDNIIPAGIVPNKASPPHLLVGWQVGDGNRGRVLAWAGMNTHLWRSYGRRATPPTREGFEAHAQFWRRMMLYLGHQEEEEGAAYARPEYRRIPTTNKQSVKIGLRTPTGVEATDPKFEVKIVAPGQKPEEAQPVVHIADGKGGNKVEFDPKLPGEYTVVLKAEGKDGTGKEFKGDATARFIAYPEASDEMLRAAADHDFLEKIAKAGSGKALRLDDLPGFLKELKGQPVVTVKPKPRFVPDWRRNHSGGFLTGWLVAFALILTLEWGLRRYWGMV